MSDEKMVRVTIRAEEVVVYRKTMDIPASAVTEYEAAEAREEDDDWFASFAERYLDRLTDVVTSQEFGDVEMTRFQFETVQPPELLASVNETLSTPVSELSSELPKGKK